MSLYVHLSFTRKLKWAVHELRHTGWKEYKCVKCGKECSNAAAFSEHVQRKVQSDNCSGGEGLTKQQLAIYSMDSKKDWQFEHTQIIGRLTTFNENDFRQPKPPMLKCRFCSREFTSKSKFEVHELRHTGWNQFKCIKCGKECSTATTFSAHVYQKYTKDCPGGVGLSKMELDDYRRQCAKDRAAEHARILGVMTQDELNKIAQKKFTRMQPKRSKDQRYHDCPNPSNKLLKPMYSCSFCHLKFGTKFSWACHELEHTGWKYYRCVKCSREFSRNCTSTFHEHIYCKRKKQMCPGGRGLNQKDFEVFRTQCKKDWQTEHVKIIGKRKNTGTSKQNDQTDTQVNISHSDVSDEVRTIQGQLRMKNCSVVLTRLNVLS